MIIVWVVSIVPRRIHPQGNIILTLQVRIHTRNEHEKGQNVVH